MRQQGMGWNKDPFEPSIRCLVLFELCCGLRAGAASKATGIPEGGGRQERLVQPASADPAQSQAGPERQRGPVKSGDHLLACWPAQQVAMR